MENMDQASWPTRADLEKMVEQKMSLRGIAAEYEQHGLKGSIYRVKKDLADAGLKTAAMKGRSATMKRTKKDIKQLLRVWDAIKEGHKKVSTIAVAAGIEETDAEAAINVLMDEGEVEIEYVPSKHSAA